MQLTIDFESRSPESIDNGAWKYWENPFTEALMLSMKEDDRPSRPWLPQWLLKKYPELDFIFDVITDEERDALTLRAKTVEAHNATFERAGYHHRMEPAGAAPIPFKKWRCSAANAARFKLPRSLDRLCQALGTSEQKDSAGHDLMLAMCKPLGWVNGKPYYRESLNDFVNLIKYCLQDTDAEHAASCKLPKMRKRDLRTWRHTERINERGVAVDLHSLGLIVEHRDRHFEPLRKRFAQLTTTSEFPDGLTPTQTEKFKDWIREQGTEIPDLQAYTVELLINDPMVPEDVREALAIRSTVGKTSLAKVDRILECVCTDGRVRDLLMYHGAGPGRWTGKGIQVHNFPSESSEDVDRVIRDLTKDAELFTLIHGPFGVALVECLRGMLVAADDHRFLSGDFSSVEARWVAWISKDEVAMEIFRTHGLVYEAAASGIFGATLDEIVAKGKGSVERKIGKVCELALGFGGGVKAFVSMSRTQKLDLRIVVEAVMPDANEEEIEWSTKIVAMMFSDAKLKELRITREIAIACDIVKSRWRQVRVAVTQAWYALEDCAFKAVQNPGCAYQFNGIYFGVQEDFLCMKLPSGRSIYYYKPKIKEVIPPWVDKDLPEEEQAKEAKKVVTYLCAKGGGGLKREGLYGGKLMENCSMGGCMDLLDHAMMVSEDRGYPVCFTVHDEVTAEVHKSFGTLEDFLEGLTDLPLWAEGFPLKAAGWEGPRFRK